jgi:hypothetical protein
VSYTYPNGDFQRPAKLLASLGSFWSDVYHGSDDVRKFVLSRLQLEEQADQNLQESIDSLSRLSVPVYHTDLWYQLVIKESEIDAIRFAIPKYDEGFVYDYQADGSSIYYDEPASRELYAVSLPKNLAAIPAIFNRADRPTITWFEGLDYIVKEGYLKFRENPFQQDALAIREIHGDDGTVVDREASLWLFRSQWDRSHIWTHYGNILGLWLKSSARYKDLVNAVMDSLVEGASFQHIVRALAAIADTPLAASDETVIRVVKDSQHLLVITDKQVYQCAKTATTSLAAGDKISAGEPVTNTIRTFRPAYEEKPEWLIAFGLDESTTDKRYRGGLLFVDEESTVVVDTIDSKTRVRFDVRGWEDTAEQFWHDLHERGVAEGKTLANLLDVRPADMQTGEPQAGALPATINPLQFLLDNVLHNNAVIVSLRPSEFGENCLPYWTANYLRRMIPPHQAIFLIANVSAREEAYAFTSESAQPAIKLPTATEDEYSLAIYGQESIATAGYLDEICR